MENQSNLKSGPSTSIDSVDENLNRSFDLKPFQIQLNESSPLSSFSSTSSDSSSTSSSTDSSSISSSDEDESNEMRKFNFKQNNFQGKDCRVSSNNFSIEFLFEKKFASYLRPKTRKSKRSKTVPSDLRLSPSISSNSSPIGLNQNQIESSPIKRQKLNICLVKKSYDPDHYQIKASERVEDDQLEYDETIMQSEENKAISRSIVFPRHHHIIVDQSEWSKI
ncbi:hypothetical protein NH340_JMT04007 [Sarcoptes scabiei]|nr:hypothetical protein NH340_JMT04007 [Sarcoptes scabiei]